MTLSRIRYAGHSAVFLEGSFGVLAIDPWLEHNPLCPREMVEPKQLDCIVLTHGHTDHAEDAVRLAKRSGAAVFAVFELAMLLIQAGVPAAQVHPFNKGGSMEWKGCTITLTHALHSSSFQTPAGAMYAGEACGVIVEEGPHRVYHAGDTALFSEMQWIGQRYRPTVAFLPIDGVFNMSPQDAAQAAAWLEVPKVVPIHHSTFPQLRGRPEELANALPEGCECIILSPGEELSFAGV